MVEHQPSKLRVAGSSLVSRSKKKANLQGLVIFRFNDGLQLACAGIELSISAHFFSASGKAASYFVL